MNIQWPIQEPQLHRKFPTPLFKSQNYQELRTAGRGDYIFSYWNSVIQCTRKCKNSTVNGGKE